MELSRVARWLTKQIEIDPEGVKGELESAIKTNTDFWDHMYAFGKNLFFNSQSEEVFEVTEHHGKLRITLKLTKKEIEKINSEYPPAND